MAMSRSAATKVAGAVALVLVTSSATTGFVGSTKYVTSRQPVAMQAGSESSWQPWAEESKAEQASTASGSYFGVFASLLAALVIMVAPLQEAQAAKTGGRIGGTAPSMRPKPAPSASGRTGGRIGGTTSAAQAPQVINNTVVVEKTVVVPHPVAPPVIVAPSPVYGASPFMGGSMYGAPLYVEPAPTLGEVAATVGAAMVVKSIVDANSPDRVLANQIRQDERQLDRQQNQIKELEKQIQDMKAAQPTK